MMKEVPMTGKEQGEFGLVENAVRENDETSLKSLGKDTVAVSTSV